MGKDIHFNKRDCLANSVIDKLACTVFGPDWEEIGRVQTTSLDMVTERCKRCGLERQKPQM